MKNILGLVKEYGYDMTELECDFSEHKISQLVMCHNERVQGREAVRTGEQIAQEDYGFTPAEIAKAKGLRG